MLNSIALHRILILVLLLLLLGSAFINLILYSKTTQLAIQNIQQNDSLKYIEDNKRLLLQNEADELFIAKEYASAFEIYKKIAEKNQNDSLLLRRQTQTDSAFYSNSDRSLNNSFSITASKQNPIDTLENYVGNLILNLEEEKERRIKSQEELVSQISKLEEMLEQEKKSDTNNDNKTSLQFKSTKNVDVKYFGDVKEGMANGQGIGLWATGSIYEGSWENNKRHGKGKYSWADGERYEGDFVNDFREGNGAYYWKNGEKYIGEWKADKREGLGILYDKKGKIKYKGSWSGDKFHSK